MGKYCVKGPKIGSIHGQQSKGVESNNIILRQNPSVKIRYLQRIKYVTTTKPITPEKNMGSQNEWVTPIGANRQNREVAI
jgi:hypothetical protein